MRDETQTALARRINARLPGWLVIWSPWRECFTAFGACTPRLTIVDERDPQKLLDRACEAQLAAAMAAGHPPDPGGENPVTRRPMNGVPACG